MLIKEKALGLGREADVKISFDSQCRVKIATTRLYTIIEELIDNCLNFLNLIQVFLSVAL